MVAKLREPLILAAILTVGFAVRYSLTTINLPVSANVDERSGLRILYHFHGGEWNPEWFRYPTFYYYLTRVLLAPFPFDSVLQYGRALNLLFGCLLAASAYSLARQVYQIPVVGLVAAALTMCSPTLIENARYLSTDVLSAALSLLSLVFLARFYEGHHDRDWFLGMAFAGLAISTKYTALVVLLSYLALELSGIGASGNGTEVGVRKGSALESRVPRWVVAAGFAALGLAALTFATTFPLDGFLALVERAGGLDSTVDASDLTFLRSVQTFARYAGVTVLTVAGVIWRFPGFARHLCQIRPYAGVALAGLVFVLASPFVLLSPQDFVYDLGAELKANALSPDGPQWLAYLQRYTRWESTLVLAFFSVGCAASAARGVGARLLGLYLLLGYIAIGSANRGFERYLTPLLPVVFIVAAWGMWCLAGARDRLRPAARVAVVVACAALGGYQLLPRVAEVLQSASIRDSSYSAFVTVSQRRARRVLYSGDAVPSIELRVAGMDVTQLPRAWLEGSSRAFVGRLGHETVVVLDGVAERSLSPSVRAALEPIWNDGDDTLSPDNRLYIYEPKSYEK